MNLPSVQEMEAYIRQAAMARGIDPEIAVRVAKSEGLAPGVWQAGAMLSYGRERSYGPFQLHVAPQGHRPGLGNAFIASTGLDPADPANWRQGVDFALNQASKTGWRDWFGAKRVGIPVMAGINGAQAVPMSAAAPAPMGAAMGGFMGGPSQVAARSLQGVQVSPTGGSPPTGAETAAAVVAPRNNAYTQMMARSLEKTNTPANEAAKVMKNVTTPGTGFQLPSLGSIGALLGGAGGKGGSGGGANVAPAAAPAPAPVAPPAQTAAAAVVPPTPRLAPSGWARQPAAYTAGKYVPEHSYMTYDPGGVAPEDGADMGPDTSMDISQINPFTSYPRFPRDAVGGMMDNYREAKARRPKIVG